MQEPTLHLHRGPFVSARSDQMPSHDHRKHPQSLGQSGSATLTTHSSAAAEPLGHLHLVIELGEKTTDLSPSCQETQQRERIKKRLVTQG